MSESTANSLIQKGRSLGGRFEVKVGILWMLEGLLNGRLTSLAIPPETMSMAWIVGTLGFLTGGVGAAGLLLLRLRTISLTEAKSHDGPFVGLKTRRAVLGKGRPS
jgi:hypothetical protein